MNLKDLANQNDTSLPNNPQHRQHLPHRQSLNANPAKFSDVQDNPFAKEIAWLEEQGITTGWPDGTFRPGQAIDRDAMAAFIARYMKKFDHVQTVPAH